MKKILHIVEAMGGGVFTYMVDLANQLCKEYEVYIAYATRPQTPDDYIEYFDKRVNLIKVDNFVRPICIKKDVVALLELRKIVKKVKPDIIHLHSSKAGVLGRLGFNGRKIPLFYTPHGYSFLMKDASVVKRTLYKSIEYICGKRKCVTIACSKGEYEISTTLAKEAYYVNNGINVKKLAKFYTNQNKKRNEKVIYTLGRICYQKNPAQFNEIASKFPEFRFVWIGEGELLHELTSSNIEVTGWVEREEALKYSCDADIFLLTSLWEGLPISLLESMCMGKLCLVSNVIGNRDVIENGRNGFVCSSTEEFVNIISNIDKYDVEKIKEEARQDTMNKYNTDLLGVKYSKIYQKYIR